MRGALLDEHAWSRGRSRGVTRGSRGGHEGIMMLAPAKVFAHAELFAQGGRFGRRPWDATG
eukprot:5233870-Prymnesium_polylepis.1